MTLGTPWAVACQAPLAVGFPKQEYWSGLPFPSLGDLPDPGIEHTSPALAGGFSTSELPGKSVKLNCVFPNLEVEALNLYISQ